MEILLVILTALQAYLLGSINFAVVFSHLFTKKDVRDFGSGNAGMTNVLRVSGPLPGILTFLCDIAKAFLACYIGRYIIFEYLFDAYPQHSDYYVPIYGALLCGVFCMLGHVFPLYFQFKGGKAVACSVGIFLIVDWRCMVVSLLIFIIVVLICKIVSVGSLIATISMPINIMLFQRNIPNENVIVSVVLTLFMVLIIYLKHIENIKRIFKGEEKPLKIKKD